MFCGKCGKPLADDVQFCSHCGAKLNVIEASPENSSNIAVESNSSTAPPVTPQPSQDMPYINQMYISLLDEAQNCFDYGEIVLGETCSLKNGATILVTPLANGNVLLDLETAAGSIEVELIK